MISLEDLHESTVAIIEIDWLSGVAVFTIQMHYKGEPLKVLLKAIGLREMHLPRFEPWGPSDFIEYALVDKLPPQYRLSVKMQSGDVITMIIDNFSLEII